MNTNPSTDPEIERIQQKKMAEMLKRAQIQINSAGISKPIILTDSNFSAEIAKYDLLVVDFWAPWCGPCRMMTPTFEEVAKKFPLKIRFTKLNTEDFGSIASRYSISGIPTMILFKNGKEHKRISGALDAQSMIQWLS